MSTELSKLRITATYLYNKLTLWAWYKYDDKLLAEANHNLRVKYLDATEEIHVLGNDTARLQSGFDQSLERVEAVSA